MSSGRGGGIGGGVAAGRGGGRGGGGTHRKNSKKFGKNLNKLTKAPAAPPVPVISVGSRGSSTSSFRGSSSSRNGLLLLSTKSKSAGGSGLLASSGTPKTAHDALLFSAGAGGRGREAADKKPPAPAWGMGEKKLAASPPDKRGEEKATRVDENENSDLVLHHRNSFRHSRPLTSSTLDVRKVAERIECVDLNDTDSPKKSVCDHPKKAVSVGIVASGEKIADEPRPNAVTSKESIPQKAKDEQVEYMSKLAKERAEKLRLEEEARMAAQKERAAMRLRELEEKRLRELEEKRLEERKKHQIKSEARKEFSKPQVILEPLGKSKKDTSDSFSAKSTSNSPNDEKKNGGRTLYDPDRPFSTLVGGKLTKSLVDSTKKQEDHTRGNTKRSPIIGPASAPHAKPLDGQSSAESKQDDQLPPVHMVQLSNLDELDRGERGGGQSNPRMLFDPSSGSMVAAPLREEPKSSVKKSKQKGPQKSPAKHSDEVSKIMARRPVDASFNDNHMENKQLRGRQGRGNRKDESVPSHQKNKKLMDNKGRQHQTPRKRLPRTCGVLYKMDKSGDYVNADGCAPDNGYGSYHVPGGKVRNPYAYAKVLKRQEEERSANLLKSSDAPTEGFSFRNDPGFLQHQTDFEAQQQKILEDAWASLVENEEPKDDSGEEIVEEVPASKSGDDEYAAALAISPSMIGLDYDTADNIDSVMLPPAIKAASKTCTDEPIDLAKYALEAASSASMANAANPFSPLGVGLWGAGAPSTNTSLGNSGALTGWDATPFSKTETAAVDNSAELAGSNSYSSKLHLWGSSGLDSLDEVGISSFGNSSDTQKGAA